MANPLPVIPGRLPAASERYDRENEAMTRRIIELALARGPTAASGTVDLAESDGVLLEAIDRLGSSAGVSLIPSGSVRSSTTAGIFFLVTTGAGHPYAVHGGISSSVRKSSATDGALCATPEWPVFSDWDSIGLSVSLFRPLRYVYSCVVLCHDAGCEIGVKQDPDLIASSDQIMGYVLVDDGGTWAMQRRLTLGGSLEDLDVLVEVTSTDPHKLTIVYDEGPLPTLTFIMDGEIIYQTSGVANMPDQPATGSYGPAVAGDIITLDNRITISEITE